MLDFNEHPYDDDDKLKLDNYHKKKVNDKLSSHTTAKSLINQRRVIQ